jgi:hypothetical protein
MTNDDGAKMFKFAPHLKDKEIEKLEEDLEK